MESSGRRSLWKRALLSALLVAVLAFSWTTYRAVRVSWDAELNLHATLFAIRLVEEFVQTNQRWPTSWNELETLNLPSDPPKPKHGKLSVVRIGGSHGYEWPRESENIRQRVQINFTPDIEALIRQNPMEFDAVKPIGPSYQYRKYGFVESLQETLQEAITGNHEQPENKFSNEPH